MQITFSPVRSDETLILARRDDALLINGEVFDFAPLPEGGTLPADAVESAWFVGPVRRVGGGLHLTVMLPHGADAPSEALFPVPVIVEEDGPIPLPGLAQTKEEPFHED